MKADWNRVGRECTANGLNISTRHWERPGLQLCRVYARVAFGPGDIERISRERITDSLSGAGWEIDSVPTAQHRVLGQPEGSAHAWRKIVFISADQTTPDPQA